MFKKTLETSDPTLPSLAPWRVLIVDDEPEVHAITRLTLSGCDFLGRSLEFLSAYSAAEGMRILASTEDIALAFVDVVMESDRAGLDLVTHVRQELNNAAIRLILRTGQPGQAPERRVVHDFDINDYISKSQLTADKLYTATLAALRAYSDITTLERSRQQLDRYRQGLEAVIEASSNLFEQRSLSLFATGLLRQLGAMLEGTSQSMILRNNGVTLVQTHQGFEVLARTGRFEDDAAQVQAGDVFEKLKRCMELKHSLIEGDVFVGYFPTKSGIINLLYLDGVQGANLVDLKLLEIFSKNISIAFENLYLDREIFETQSEIIMTLGDVVETRSHEAGNHVQRVSRLAYMLAQAIGLPEDQCQLVAMASPMHDVGKVAIPDSILLKPGSLDSGEWQHMKRHALIGEEVFGHSSRPMLRAAAIIAGQHHEKWDGSGYPRQLRGEEIHIFGRIVALVDVFDALIHKRSYKEAWPPDKVKALLLAESGKHFDPGLVTCFLNHFDQALQIVSAYADQDEEESPAEPAGSPR